MSFHFSTNLDLPILTDGGFLPDAGDKIEEIMMKMSRRCFKVILLQNDDLFSPPVLHSFVCMIFCVILEILLK